MTQDFTFKNPINKYYLPDDVLLAQIYFVHSLTQLSPELWKTLNHPYVMISADNALYNVNAAVEKLRGLKVIVDSGGFRLISRGRLPNSKEIIQVQQVLLERIGALPVLLDTPVPNPLRATEQDFYAANKATAKNAKLWARVFGDHFIYPLHAHTEQQLREALQLAKQMGVKPVSYGLGSLAPLARYRPLRVIEIVTRARELVESKLHAFGIGNGVAVLLARWKLVDTLDTSSPLMDAKYGLVRHPETGAMTLVVPQRASSRPRSTPDQIAALCQCPICRTEPQLLAAWGRVGVLARTIHNAYHMLQALRNPDKTAVFIRRHPRLRKLLYNFGIEIPEKASSRGGA
jgi:queuine/archaeosine tRNA-ribosyltransferase